METKTYRLMGIIALDKLYFQTLGISQDILFAMDGRNIAKQYWYNFVWPLWLKRDIPELFKTITWQTKSETTIIYIYSTLGTSPYGKDSSCRMTRAQPISDTHCETPGNKLHYTEQPVSSRTLHQNINPLYCNARKYLLKPFFSNSLKVFATTYVSSRISALRRSNRSRPYWLWRHLHLPSIKRRYVAPWPTPSTRAIAPVGQWIWRLRPQISVIRSRKNRPPRTALRDGYPRPLNIVKLRRIWHRSTPHGTNTVISYSNTARNTWSPHHANKNNALTLVNIPRDITNTLSLASDNNLEIS